MKFVATCTFMILLLFIMAMYAAELSTESLRDTLASLTGFWMILALTSYLVLVLLRFGGYQRKRAVQRCRVRPCLWTRRKVFQLRRGQSRTKYILAARECSIKARKYFGNEAFERIQEVPKKNCSNILKQSTLALIAVIAGTDLQVVNYLVQSKENIYSLSNFTLKNRNSEYTLVLRDKAKVKKPTLVRLTIFRVGMGLECSSDTAGDGLRKRIEGDDD